MAMHMALKACDGPAGASCSGHTALAVVEASFVTHDAATAPSNAGPGIFLIANDPTTPGTVLYACTSYPLLPRHGNRVAFVQGSGRKGAGVSRIPGTCLRPSVQALPPLPRNAICHECLRRPERERGVLPPPRADRRRCPDSGRVRVGASAGRRQHPLDRIGRALPELRKAAEHKPLLVVCASGARAENAVATLASHGIGASSLTGGTTAWAAEGHGLDRPEGRPRAVWAMERQVRFTAGSVVLLGLGLGFFVHPAFQLLSAGIAAGLVFSAVSNTCGMAVVLGRLPFNQRGKAPLPSSSQSFAPSEPRA